MHGHCSVVYISRRRKARHNKRFGPLCQNRNPVAVSVYGTCRIHGRIGRGKHYIKAAFADFFASVPNTRLRVMRGSAKLYNSGIIDRRTAERMLAFCVNAGPAMIIIAVGGGMLGDTIAGWILYASHIAASVIIGAVWARFAKRCEEPSDNSASAPSLADAFVNATSSACVSMLTICGYVTLFSSIIELTNTFAPWFAVFAEVTCGAKLAADSGLSVPLISAILGFGGISVMCQVSAMSEGLIRMPVLLFTRCMHAGLSYLICGGLLRLFNRPMEVISNLGSAAADFSIITVPLSLSMLVMATTFLFAIQHKS